MPSPSVPCSNIIQWPQGFRRDASFQFIVLQRNSSLQNQLMNYILQCIFCCIYVPTSFFFFKKCHGQGSSRRRSKYQKRHICQERRLLVVLSVLLKLCS